MACLKMPISCGDYSSEKELLATYILLIVMKARVFGIIRLDSDIVISSGLLQVY